MSGFKGVVCLFNLFGQCLQGCVQASDISAQPAPDRDQGVPESTDDGFLYMETPLVLLPVLFALFL